MRTLGCDLFSLFNIAGHGKEVWALAKLQKIENGMKKTSYFFLLQGFYYVYNF